MVCSIARRFSGSVGNFAALIFLLQFFQLSAWPQNAPSNAANAPLQNYVEEFLLSDAVRSEDKGEVQFTISAEGLRHRGTDAGLDIECGITNRLQFTFEAPYGIQQRVLSDTPVSWSAASIGGQYQFIRSNHPFALSAAFAFGVPLNSRGEGDYEPEILLAKGVGRSQFHFSAGGEIGQHDKSWNYNAAWVRPASRQWLTTFELNGRRTDGANGLYFTPGIYHHLFPRFARRIEVGAGVPAGIGPAASHLGLAAKLTVEFGGDDDD
jgi:hypothetical protein